MDVEKIDKNWDLVVIGGGITGAGVLREAVRMGLKTLLLEKNDFAWGTSSRSSKLVHGGLRYLKQGRLHLTYESVCQRQRLLEEAPGLVEEIQFLMPVYEKTGPGRVPLTAGLILYDLMARKRYHAYFDKESFSQMVPGLNPKALKGGFRFMDAQTDDARLVMRLINESVKNGGMALNYTAATRIIRNEKQAVCGVEAQDAESGKSAVFATTAIINATGAWAESFHTVRESGMHLRPLRGSHLVIPAARIPLPHAVTLVHPDDKRPLFIIPWEGALILGTTDLDHNNSLDKEITTTLDEANYMLKCLNFYFPEANISLNDCVASFAGIRPVLTKKDSTDPSKESREHVIWSDKGLVTVTGGKLTTFRVLAGDALKKAAPFLPGNPELNLKASAFTVVPQSPGEKNGLSTDTWRRLYGRYGEQAATLVNEASEQDLSYIPGTHTLWAELPLVAKTEQIRHLTDLLLRRVRIGMLLPDGGREHFDRIRQLCAPVLPWNDEKWKEELKIYSEYIAAALRVPS